jgi:hypothetical protein
LPKRLSSSNLHLKFVPLFSFLNLAVQP